ncbi:uncharacterized protein [Bactrocera oleae]|uniref:uncharacterized protein isoform X1 n=1 Tax=Bactrocera oleae TaxID=104688 RepID=UPI00174C22D1|nr:uncharacterized protein LOC118682177 isoform X2 [Bactrocera oleae]
MLKLILLMAMGLGAMYMVHLLAQDYNKIRQPVAAAARAIVSASNLITRAKRDTYEDNVNVYNLLHPTVVNVTNTTTLNIDWKIILSRDPFECLQSLICQLMSGADTHSREAKLLMEFLEKTVDLAPVEVRFAFSRGLDLHGSTETCYNVYPFCIYSAKTMLRVLRWFAESPIEDNP